MRNSIRKKTTIIILSFLVFILPYFIRILGLKQLGNIFAFICFGTILLLFINEILLRLYAKQFDNAQEIYYCFSKFLNLLMPSLALIIYIAFIFFIDITFFWNRILGIIVILSMSVSLLMSNTLLIGEHYIVYKDKIYKIKSIASYKIQDEKISYQSIKRIIIKFKHHEQIEIRRDPKNADIFIKLLNEKMDEFKF
ncbi:hypothetical protein [Petroclostridium xylanilyticum]|uniref:hypothetical protein n=1 Tax=Petroclostridium xylanilyticum TaxID=1792311 RepID=UPI000B991EB3|nr:hypothetical protein [Petroclostridium xylanilyticum]